MQWRSKVLGFFFGYFIFLFVCAFIFFYSKLWPFSFFPIGCAWSLFHLHNINKHISYNIIDSLIGRVVGAIVFYRLCFSFFLVQKNSTRFHPQITCGLKVLIDAAAVCKYKLRVVSRISILWVIIISLPVAFVLGFAGCVRCLLCAPSHSFPHLRCF